MQRRRTLATLAICLLVGLLATVPTPATAEAHAGTLRMSDDAFYTSTLAFLLDTGRGLWHRFWEYLANTSQLPLDPMSGGDDVKGSGTPQGSDSHKAVKFPSSPTGATLVQLAPCSPRTNATVPMFVNDFWPKGDDKVTSAYISQHGAASDFDHYYSYMYPLVGKDSVLVAPGLYKTNAVVAPSTWYQPTHNMAWTSGTDSWAAGVDAIRPSTGANRVKPSSKLIGCSSFDTFDAILARLADKSLFPRLANVYFVGHSGGANMVSRYAQLSNLTNAYGSLHIRYVIMNAANQAYFDSARPWLATEKCPSAFLYPYQLTSKDGKMPRYVQQQFDAVLSGNSNDADKTNAILKRWVSRDVVHLVGNRDTATTGTQRCMSVAQGGSARRDRNYAFWAYQNILAGTSADVQHYFGYGNLTRTGVTSHPQASGTGGNFTHQICVVDGVAHSAHDMLKSDCGHSALFDETLPSGAVP